MTSAADWRARVGDVWADQWVRTDRSFSGLDPFLLGAALDGLPDAAGVFDIGCGAGGTAIAIKAARPNAQVTGIDLSPALIDAATARAAMLPVDRRPGFRVEDASRIGDGSADLLVSRHGVMFFDDPVGAFRRMRAATRHGGRFVFSCFAGRGANDWATLPARALGLEGDAADGQAGGPGPFAFALPEEVAAILTGAGWAIEPPRRVDYAYRAGEGPDAAVEATALFTRIGPTARAIADASPDRRARLLERLNALCAAREAGGAVDFAAAAWIWTARRQGERE